MKKIIMITASLCMATSAHAGGYRVSLQGQKALGMGHTGVAMSDSSEVVFFNPAGMSYLESDMEITAGITLIDSEIKYQNSATNSSAKTDSPLGTPISVYLTKKHNDQVSWGIGLYTPYGNSVEWPTDWVGSHLVNEIELKSIYIQPTISYQFNDKFSMGFGPTYVSGQVEFNRNLSSSLTNADGDRSNVTIKATGVDSWGYNLGFQAKPNDQLTVGLSYRSKVDLEARNESADFSNIPTSMQALYTDTTFDADLVLPAELTLGMSYQINPQTTLAFDINRAYWSDYNSLDIIFDNAAGVSYNPRNYKDANIYRLGVQHQLDDEMTLRAGIYLDETPVPKNYVTPETARNDALGYTAGLTYQVSDNLELDASLLIVTHNEFDGSYEPQSFGGSWQPSATSIGVGFNYTF